MRTLLLAAAVLASSSARAQVPLVRLVPFRLDVGRCFARAPQYPDRERVEPHLPAAACVKSVSGVLAFSEDGSVRVEGAAGPSARATPVGGAIYGLAREFAVHDAPLKVSASASGYRASVVADETPEDPAGDSGRVSVEFALDRGGRPVPGSAVVVGRVVCTFAPVCREEDLEIGYDDVGPMRG